MTLLTEQQIDFVERLRVAHLATVDEAGQPHVLPICYAAVQGVIYSTR